MGHAWQEEDFENPFLFEQEEKEKQTTTTE